MKILNNILLIGGISILSVACDVDKTEPGDSGELDVDVQAEAPELPEYDVDWANVTVDTRTKTVTVPKLVVVQEEEEVEVPYVDVSMPDDPEYGERVERTIMVEAEVSDMMHTLDISKIYASEDNLIVVAELIQGDQALQDQTVRVSDQIVMNVPEDLDIKRFIVGARPTGEFNNQYEYITNEDQLMQKYTDAQVIYQ
jgi:hypothetical protein